MRNGRGLSPSGWDGILEEGETILWQGAPDGAVDFSGIWSLQSLFAVFFTGFSLFWIMLTFSITAQMTDNIGQVFHLAFPLFGVPFLLVGLQLLLGRFWADARRRRNSHYTLTNRAAYIGVRTKGTRSLDRYAIGPNNPITLEEGTLGAIWFARASYSRPRVMVQPGRGVMRGGATNSQARIGFERLADAREVYAMMRKVQIAQANPEGGNVTKNNVKGDGDA